MESWSSPFSRDWGDYSRAASQSRANLSRQKSKSKVNNSSNKRQVNFIRLFGRGIRKSDKKPCIFTDNQKQNWHNSFGFILSRLLIGVGLVEAYLENLEGMRDAVQW